jgi:hypothetical protein
MVDDKTEEERRRQAQQKRLEKAGAKARALSSGSGEMTDEKAKAMLDRLYYLFGREAVFIRVLYGMKQAVGKWKKTWKQTQTPEYQAKLLATIKQGGNIAVMLGPVSGGICAIDCDLDDEWRLFLAENPYLAGRLRTRGAHGGQVFFKMKPGANYPNSQAVYPYYLKGCKEHIGEWRCGGSDKGAYSIIYGRHPDGVDYAVEVEVPIADLADFNSINWPPDWELTWKNSTQEGAPPAPEDQGGGVEEPVSEEDQIEAYLDSCEPAVSGYRGHNQTFGVACGLVHKFGLGRDKAFHYLKRYYNPKCQPPWSDADIRHKIDEALKKEAERRPALILPGSIVPYPKCAKKLFTGFARKELYFVRGGEVVEIQRGRVLDDAKQAHDSLVPLTAQALRSRIDEVFDPMVWRVAKNGKPVLKTVRCPNDAASVLLKTREALELLPVIQALYSCPVLAGEPGNIRVLGHGYHPVCGGIYITTKTGEIAIPPLEEAIRIFFDEMLCDFQFNSPSDRSRCVASFCAPALRMGALLGEGVDFPIDVGQADHSQSGKTYRQKMVCAVYGTLPYTITQKVGGVGSLDESISSAIHSGCPFILLDNFRGKINSQILESALRGVGRVNVRVPHRGELQLETGSINWMLSSNGVEGTRDFANRSVVTAIRKREEGYKFQQYTGGIDILGAIQKDPQRYLGAVFSVIIEWDRRGRPQTSEGRHAMREWSRALDWIVQELFGLAPLCDGHVEELERMSDSNLSWLRLVAIALEDEGRLGTGLDASEIAQLSQQREINIPGIREWQEANLADFQVEAQAGKILSRAFAKGNVITFNRYKVTRTGLRRNPQRNLRSVYRFERV